MSQSLVDAVFVDGGRVVPRGVCSIPARSRTRRQRAPERTRCSGRRGRYSAQERPDPGGTAARAGRRRPEPGDRRLVLMRFDGPVLLTSDAALAAWSPPDRSDTLPCFGTANKLFMLFDRRHVVCLPPGREGTRSCGRGRIRPPASTGRSPGRPTAGSCTSRRTGPATASPCRRGRSSRRGSSARSRPEGWGGRRAPT